MSVNTVYLLGRCGKDPEIRTTQTGNKVASFSLATGGKYKTNDGREVDDTAWHNIVAWRNHADLVEKFLKKGSQVFIVGHISYRDYTDNNGVKRAVTDIIVDKIELCGGKPESAPASSTKFDPHSAQTTSMPGPGEDEDGDLPF